MAIFRQWFPPPPMGASNACGLWKKRHFQPISRITLEIIQDRYKPCDVIVTMQMAIGTHTGSIKWCHFQWSWVTPNPHFKVMPLLTLSGLMKYSVSQSKASHASLRQLSFWSCFDGTYTQMLRRNMTQYGKLKEISPTSHHISYVKA